VREQFSRLGLQLFNLFVVISGIVGQTQHVPTTYVYR
jgi:hypothetical protein